MITSGTVPPSGPRVDGHGSSTGRAAVVTALEPAVLLAAGAGRFEVGGRSIRLVVEPEGWLVGWTPLEGAPDRWFARQPRIRTLAKIVEGPALRVDMPIGECVGDALEALRAVLRDALGDLEAGDAPAADDLRVSPMAAADHAAGEVLRIYAASSPWPAATDAAGGVTLVVETARGRPQRITASVGDGRLRVTAPIGPRPRGPESGRALTHFLLALNERLRLVRGSLGDAGVTLEVVLPSWSVTVDLLDRAIGAMIVATAMARRECAALLDPAVAEAFCALHRVGAPPDGAGADSPIRASLPERSVP